MLSRQNFKLMTLIKYLEWAQSSVGQHSEEQSELMTRCYLVQILLDTFTQSQSSMFRSIEEMEKKYFIDVI